MKVAYLIVTHTNPGLLRKMIMTLCSEGCAFFIHVDKKARISDFSAIEGENIFFTHSRVSVYWGEFSVIRAVIVLMLAALASREQYDYFVLLSGSDYPLRSGLYVQEFLRANQGRQFMSLVKIPSEAAGKPLSRLDRIWIQSDQPIRRFVFRAIAKLGLARRDHRKHLRSLEPYGGDMWWALTNDACRYILEFMERNPYVENYFLHTPAPDELFFQTILGNSPFAPHVQRNFHFADWSAGTSHPAMITAKHVEKFESQEQVLVNDVYGSGEALFARKFSDDAPELLTRIDTMIRRKERLSFQPDADKSR